MKQFKYYIIGGFLAALSLSCSTKKNKFVNRNYHAITAQFNPIFHGYEALEEAKEELIEDYRDDYWEVLPVERIVLSDFDEREIGYETNQTLFDRAEEKAIVAIQKHSMHIDGSERNYDKMADAYMLLGKARYFDSRFIPAIDAFNFILSRYPSSKSINDAIIWRAKTFVRLDNEEVAIQNLKQIVESDHKLKPRVEADATAMIAQAYVQMDSLREALPYIQQAAETVRDNELKGRYHFIEGQIYDRLNLKDSANLAYDKVIKLHRRTLRNYYVQAHLHKILNTEIKSEEERIAHEKFLKKFENDRENRPYLDHIYHYIGKYHQNQDSLDLSKIYYNKSIAAYMDDEKLQSINYYTLAEMNFDASLYQEAGAYYDSTLTFMPKNTLTYRRVEKKRENLSDVIKYEGIVKQTDSIVNLVNMSDADRLAYFTEYTRALEEKHIADSLEQAKREARVLAMQSGSGRGNRAGGASLMESEFYFYNSAQAARGRLAFEDIWGKRKLEDNWRISRRQGSATFEDEIAGEDEATEEAKTKRFDPQVYMASLPSTQQEIDSLVQERDFAYYQLGLIYKEKFRENDLAEARLTYLLENKPEERLVLPAKYHLYKIYEENGNQSAMTDMRNRIVNKYPESRYAQIILDPDSFKLDEENNPETRYRQTYDLYANGYFDEALIQTEKYIDQYTGEEIAPKFELLKATLIGKIQGYNAYKEALNYVALNYPNQPEGKQAEKIYSQDLPKLAFNEFVADEDSDRWKLAYSFASDEEDLAKDFVEKVKEHLDEMAYGNLKVSIDYYNPELRLVMVHGLRSRLGARGLGGRLSEERKGSKLKPIKRTGFEISSPNYEKVLIHKNLQEYLNQ